MYPYHARGSTIIILVYALILESLMVQGYSYLFPQLPIPVAV